MKTSRATWSAGKRRPGAGRRPHASARPISLPDELSAALEATADARAMSVEEALLAAVGEWLGRALVRRRRPRRRKLRVIPGRASLPEPAEE